MTTETARRPRAQTRSGGLKGPLRRLRLARLRLRRRLPLSLRFLMTALVVVAIAMLALGSAVSHYLQSGIAEGIAVSSAGTIDSLVGNELSGLAEDRPLTAEERATLDTVFEIGNEADLTRLLQIRIWRLDGSPIYQSERGLVDPVDPEDFRAAAGGRVATSIERIPLEPVGAIEGTLTALRIYMPLHRAPDDETFAVAALYYSARSLLDIQFHTQINVWIVAGMVGLGVIGVLYLIVDRASRTVALQRARLARNLMDSRRLSEEVHALHAESERLRLDANSANESLLAQVGSDIHDGPIQLLTLIILRLSRAARKPGRQGAERATTLQLATEAMEELRNISQGLVLPELAEINLAESIELAISRHEEATGTEVARQIGPLPESASMALKTCAYRIVQEALTNAFRHADAPETSVSASASTGRLTLTIRNSNTAKPDEAAAPPDDEPTQRLGLRGMRFRVESLGGELHADFGSQPVSTVTAEIPCAGQ